MQKETFDSLGKKKKRYHSTLEYKLYTVYYWWHRKSHKTHDSIYFWMFASESKPFVTVCGSSYWHKSLIALETEENDLKRNLTEIIDKISIFHKRYVERQRKK